MHAFVSSFILAHDPVIVESRWILKISFHLVVPELIHYQHKGLAFVRCAVEIIPQNRAEAAVVVISLHKRSMLLIHCEGRRRGLLCEEMQRMQCV